MRSMQALKTRPASRTLSGAHSQTVRGCQTASAHAPTPARCALCPAAGASASTLPHPRAPPPAPSTRAPLLDDAQLLTAQLEVLDHKVGCTPGLHSGVKPGDGGGGGSRGRGQGSSVCAGHLAAHVVASEQLVSLSSLQVLYRLPPMPQPQPMAPASHLEPVHSILY